MLVKVVGLERLDSSVRLGALIASKFTPFPFDQDRVSYEGSEPLSMKLNSLIYPNKKHSMGHVGLDGEQCSFFWT